MQISGLQKPGFTDLPEKTTTENVSTHGVRVLTKRALPPQERLLVTSLSGSDEPIPARVVYCQPLAEGVFGVGLQFERKSNGLKQSFQLAAVESRDGRNAVSNYPGSSTDEIRDTAFS